MPKKILVVEDNELNLKLFCDLLRAHGYEAEPVRDGREAMATAREFVPDLIVMDIQMPALLAAAEHREGDGAAEEAQAHHPGDVAEDGGARHSGAGRNPDDTGGEEGEKEDPGLRRDDAGPNGGTP